MKKNDDPLDARKLNLKTGGLLGLIPNEEESPSEQDAAHKRMQEMLQRTEEEKAQKEIQNILPSSTPLKEFPSATPQRPTNDEEKELAENTRKRLEWQANYKKWRDSFYRKGSKLNLKKADFTIKDILGVGDEEEKPKEVPKGEPIISPEEAFEQELERKVTGPKMGPKNLPSVSIREPGASTPPTVPAEVLEEIGYKPRTPEESRSHLEEVRKQEQEEAKKKKEPPEKRPEGETFLQRLDEIKREKVEEESQKQLERLEGYFGRLDEFGKVLNELEPLGKSVENASANIESAKALIDSSELGTVTKERAVKNFTMVPSITTIRNFAITLKGSLTEEGEKNLAAIMPKQRKELEEWIENTPEGQQFEQKALDLWRIRKVEQLLSNSMLSMENLKVIQKKMPPGVQEGEYISQQTKKNIKEEEKERKRKQKIEETYDPVIKDQFYKLRNAETPAEKAAVDTWLASPEGQSSKDRIMNGLIRAEEEKSKQLKNIVRKKDIGKLPEDAVKFLAGNFNTYDDFATAVSGQGEYSEDVKARAKELYDAYPRENIDYMIKHKTTQKPKYWPRKRRSSLNLKKILSKLSLRKTSDTNGPGGDDWGWEWVDNSPSKVTDPKERRKHRFPFHNQPSTYTPGEGEQGNLFDVGPLGGQSDMNYLSSIYKSMNKTADNDIFEIYSYSTNKGSWLTYTLFKKASNIFKAGDVVVQYGLSKEDANTFRRRFGSVDRAKKNIQRTLTPVLADVVGVPTPGDSLSESQTGVPGMAPYKKRVDYDKPEGVQRDGFDFIPPKRKTVVRPFIPFMDTPDSEGVGFGDQFAVQGNTDKIEKKSSDMMIPQVETPEERAWREQPADNSISAGNPNWLMPPKRKRPTELNETQLYNGQYAETPRTLLSKLNLKKQAVDQNKVKWLTDQLMHLLRDLIIKSKGMFLNMEPMQVDERLTRNVAEILRQNLTILTNRKITSDVVEAAVNEVANTIKNPADPTAFSINISDPALQEAINQFPEGPREIVKTLPQLTADELRYLEEYEADVIWDKAVAGDPIARSMIEKGTVASRLNLKKIAKDEKE